VSKVETDWRAIAEWSEGKMKAAEEYAAKLYEESIDQERKIIDKAAMTFMAAKLGSVEWVVDTEGNRILQPVSTIADHAYYWAEVYVRAGKRFWAERERNEDNT
jgi:hypothetical protein